MDNASVCTQLKEIFARVLRLPGGANEVPDHDLIHKLGIDSVSSLEILVWVENEFGIEIDDRDLSPRLVDSLEVLSDYVVQRKALA